MPVSPESALNISLDFQQAKARHLQFKQRLRSWLYDEPLADKSPVIYHYECPVGKWLYGHALAIYQHIPEIHELERVHADIHTQARLLIALYQAGRVEEARRGLAGMEQIADHLVQLLEIIEQKQQEATQEESVTLPIEPQELSILQELLQKNEILDQKIKTQSGNLLSEHQALHNFFLQAPGILCILRGPEHVFELANPGYLQLVGNRNTINKPVREALPELDGQGFFELLDTVYTSQEAFMGKEVPVWLDRGNGKPEEAFIDFIYQPIVRGTETTGILVSGYDITEQIRARKKVEELEERNRLAVDAALLGTFDMDMSTNEVVYSARFHEIFGLTGTHASPDDFLRLIHPDDLPVREAANQRLLETGSLDYELRIIRSDGLVRWINNQSKLFRNAAKKPARYIGVIRDVTEQKMFAQELENSVRERTQELITANQNLEKMNQELASFAYISSHDLQEPLRKIQTFATRLLNKESATLSVSGKDYVERMQNAARRMQELIEDLLAYSRTNTGDRKIEPTDLNTLLASVIEELDRFIQEKQALITIEPLPILPVIAYQFRQLFTNLLSNALKFSVEGIAPSISIQCSVTPGASVDHPAAQADQSYHHLTCRDHGIGFEPAYRDRIFEVFQRLHGRAEYEGTGIGLAICKKIVDNHRGIITAEGKPGQGATFHIYLPID